MMAPKRKARRPPLEVVSQFDGAWYDGDVSLEGSCLRVHFNGFGHEVDEFWDEKFLESPTRIKEIVRLRSKQLQDAQCSKVVVGMIVCANFKTTNGAESKYYDAKVLMVHHSQHFFKKKGKEELCNCRFKLAWENGPCKSKEIYLGCVDISFINDKSVGKHPLIQGILQNAHKCVQKSENKKIQTRFELMESHQQLLLDQDFEGSKIDSMQQGQDLSIEDVHTGAWFEQTLPIEYNQIQSENKLLIENIHVDHIGLLDDGLTSGDINEDVFSSIDIEGLSDDMIQKVKNYNNFHRFLGEEANKLKKALETYNFKNNISFS